MIPIERCFPLLLFASFHISCPAQLAEPVPPDDRKRQTMVTEPVTVYKGFLRAGLSAAYEVSDKVFIKSKRQSTSGNVWGSAFSFSLYGQYGISDRLMVEMLVPYIWGTDYHSAIYEAPLDPNEEYIYPREWRTQANGVGDIDLTLAYQLLRETESRPALAAFVTTTFPTGEKNLLDNNDGDVNTFTRPTGQGEFAVNTLLRLRQVKYPFSYSLSAAYKYRAESSKVIAVGEPEAHYRNGKLIHFGGSFNLQVNGWVALKNAVDFLHFGPDSKDGQRIREEGWRLLYFPGISFQFNQFRLDQGVSIPVAGSNAAADPRYILVFQYNF